MLARLAFRPEPLPIEGLNGYLLRLAEGNGFSGIHFLVQNHAVTTKQLKEWLGLERGDALWYMLPQIKSSRTTYFQQWNYKSSRYCPDCLQENPVWRREWECLYYTVCAVHGCRLVELCGSCCKPLTWRRTRLLYCDCGVRLQGERVEASADEVKFASAIRSRVVYERCPFPMIRFLSLAELCQLIHIVGMYANPKEGKGPNKVAGVHNLKIAHQMTAAVAKIIIHWPSAFYQMLDELRSRNSGEHEATGLPQQYGYFYSQAFNYLRARCFSFLHKAFEAHIVHSWLRPLTRRNKQISVEGRASGIWLPANQAAQQLGTTRKRLDQLYEATLIDLRVRRTETGRRVVCVDRGHLPGIKQLLENLIDQQTACAICHIEKSRMSQLLRHKVVETATGAPQPGKRWDIAKASVERLLLLGQGLPTAESVSAINSIRMDAVLRYWLQQEFLFPTLIRALQNGEISLIAVSPDLPGIQGWIFDYDQLQQWCHDQVRKARNGAMTIPQVALRLKVKQEVAYHFVKSRLLKVSTMKGRGGTVLITEEDFKQFTDHYGLSSEFAELIKTSPSQATRMLQRQGIKPVCGKSIDGGRQYLYRRDAELFGALDRLHHRRD